MNAKPSVTDLAVIGPGHGDVPNPASDTKDISRVFSQISPIWFVFLGIAEGLEVLWVTALRTATVIGWSLTSDCNRRGTLGMMAIFRFHLRQRHDRLS